MSQETLLGLSGLIGNDTVLALNNFNQAQAHCESPGEVLGVRAFENPGLEALIVREFSDGSVLLPIDHASLALVRALPVGSVVGTMRSRDSKAITDDVVNRLETVAIVVEHNQQGSLLFGLNRKPRNQGESVGVWGTYEVDGHIYSEKDDAIDSLKRLLDPEKGVEATQILSLVLTPQVGSNGNRTASEAECDSHNKPTAVLPGNLLRGFTSVHPPILLAQPDTTRYLRVKVGSSGLTPIDEAVNRIDDQTHLLAVGLIARAEAIASANPTNMGSGTKTGKVLEAVLSTVADANEMVGNGATVGQVNQKFRRNLGVL